MPKKVTRLRKYRMEDENLNQMISNLIKEAGLEDDRPFLEEMIVTALKLGKDAHELGDIKMMNTAMKELRYALKVFYPYAKVRKAAVFGSARTKKSDPNYKIAKTFSKLLVRKNWMVITGAASGIMQAGNEGAGRENSFGVNIRLPFEQDANPHILGDDKLINFKYFFTRKLVFVACSDATVLCPGGFGTHDEGFETLTLVQTGKATSRPIVCLDAPGSTYWKSWRSFLKRELAANKMIDPNDLNMIYFTQDAKAAVQYIENFYRNYHSQRYVRDKMVFRIKRPLSSKALQTMNKKFKDILVTGGFEQHAAPFPEEENEPQTFDLTRIAFHFDRHHYARLYPLIDLINES